MKAREAGIEDAFTEAGGGDISVADFVSILRDTDFAKRMTQIEGQQAIHVDDRGNVTTGPAPDKADLEAAKAKRTGLPALNEAQEPDQEVADAS